MKDAMALVRVKGSRYEGQIQSNNQLPLMPNFETASDFSVEIFQQKVTEGRNFWKSGKLFKSEYLNSIILHNKYHATLQYSGVL